MQVGGCVIEGGLNLDSDGWGSPDGMKGPPVEGECYHQMQGRWGVDRVFTVF